MPCDGVVAVRLSKAMNGPPPQADKCTVLNAVCLSHCRKGQDGQSEAVVPTEMPLPGAHFARPSLQISTQLPGRATAGQAFPVSLRIANLTPQLQQLSVAVGDASGFVIAGRPHPMLWRRTLHTLHSNL